VHRRVDTRGEDLELRYFRDIDGREVNFVAALEPPPAPRPGPGQNLA
jgi:hypothetical protein